MSYYRTDPILLAAQARPVLEALHKQNDVVVRFKTDSSGYDEDALTDVDRLAPGHFQMDKNLLTLNLDKLIPASKPKPESLSSLEDFRKYPVLAGVAAHESGHARWSGWHEIPESIPNPEFDPANPTKEVRYTDPDGTTAVLKEPVPESFKVSGNGKLIEIAVKLEEPRIERLGAAHFTKTWRRAMQFSAGHLILEQVDEMDADGKDPLDSAIGLAILVGGRVTAGTLGVSYESRKSVKKVLESAQSIIEKAVAEQENPVEDPFHKIMGIVNEIVFSNEHDDSIPYLEAARKILKIVYPESADNPDQSGDGGSGGEGEGGSGSGEGEGEDGEGGGSALSEAAKSALQEMAGEMKKALDGMAEELADMVKSEEEAPADRKQERGGYGSTLYKNPRAPQISHHEQPKDTDRELYRRARDWMERQIEPTVTESEVSQWLPTGGARLDMRSKIRDDLAGHKANQRSDWTKVSETVKPAPPVKVGIMLDGSGSMSAFARPSAAIAWAAANAAADLPESRTVSVVYGNAAQVTQEPGHRPAKTIAVSNTDGGTEAFVEAAQMVEDALWLNEPMEEGERTNVLIVIVSDLMYGGEHRHPDGRKEPQLSGFLRITKEWSDKGFRVMVVGAQQSAVESTVRSGRFGTGAQPEVVADLKNRFTIVEPEDLFK